MFESKPLAENLPQIPDSAANSPDLDQRLGLYRVFLKLYEHHRELLDEILDLENTDGRYRTRGVWRYIQAGFDDKQAYLTTNLLAAQTARLVQPQNIWVIGRDRKAGISIQDKRLSRRHAMIQYVQNRGFYLIDLNSTNGSYVNGEALRKPVQIKDGDRIRLGSLSFVFFLCQGEMTLEATSPGLAREFSLLEPTSSKNSLAQPTGVEFLAADGWDEPLAESEKETSMFLSSAKFAPQDAIELLAPQLSTDQKAEILDRFLKR